MSSSCTKQFFILTGDPGVGKTTLMKKLSTALREKGFKTKGFYTEEVRKNGVREGFDVISLDGNRGRLARDLCLLTGTVKQTVGKYGVLVQEFQKIALDSLQKPKDASDLFIIDEIGKMEFFSEPFKARIRDIFCTTSTCVVLATIPIRKSDGLIECIRTNSLSRVWLVTKDNRNRLHNEILKEISSVVL